jgi:hypothetical protein
MVSEKDRTAKERKVFPTEVGSKAAIILRNMPDKLCSYRLENDSHHTEGG